MLRLCPTLTRGAAAALRRYSGPPPYALAHQQLQDMEGLFEKYQLHKIRSTEKIDELVRSGAISEHIAAELHTDLKTQQEAGSTPSLWSGPLG